MKLRIVSVQEVEIDMEQERDRIRRLGFLPGQKTRLFHLCDLFEANKFEECCQFVSTWGRCPKEECPEVEFISMEMYDVMSSFHRGKKVEQV